LNLSEAEGNWFHIESDQPLWSHASTLPLGLKAMDANPGNEAPTDYSPQR